MGNFHDPRTARALQDRAERLAASIGDDYGLVVLQALRSMQDDVGPALRDMARERQDRYLEAYGTLISPWVLAFHHPAAAVSLLDTDEFAEASRESTSLSEFADLDRALVALGLGDLPACLQLSSRLMDSRSTFMVAWGVYLATYAGILSADRTLLGAAGDVAQRRLLDEFSGGLARHYLNLLEGGPPSEDPFLRPDTDHMSPQEIHLAAREAIEAGRPELARSATQERVGSDPYDQAVLALIEAEVLDSEDKWHHALQIAADHHLRLVVINALEGLAVVAGRSESWAESLRLYGAAQRLREECQYRWRFPSHQAAIDQTTDAARSSSPPTTLISPRPRAAIYRGPRPSNMPSGHEANENAPATAGPRLHPQNYRLSTSSPKG